MNAVAFFTDRAMLPGLHVAILSLLESLPAGEAVQLDIHAFLGGVGQVEQELLRRTHASRSGATQLHLHDYSPRAPAHASSLHGNYMTWGRLYLPELLPAYARCLYLDCDLVICRSVLPLFDQFDGHAALLVDNCGHREDTLEREFLRRAGIEMDHPSFNAGVLGMDLDVWRRDRLFDLCRETAARNVGMPNADEALLNLALHDRTRTLGATWNTRLYPSTAPIAAREARIYHFVGSPKPWDLFGARLVRNHALWRSYYERTALRSRSYLRYMSTKRTLRIGMQSARAMRALLRGN